MYKQVKFITGNSLDDLETRLNDYLKSVDSDVSIKYDFNKSIAVVEQSSTVNSELCCECLYWHDEGGLNGKCKLTGDIADYRHRCNRYRKVK